MPMLQKKPKLSTKDSYERSTNRADLCQNVLTGVDKTAQVKLVRKNLQISP